MQNNTIQRVEIKNLWGKYRFIWDDLHQDVNILVGINGSFKTTILNILNAILSGDRKVLKYYQADIFITFSDGSQIGFKNDAIFHSGKTPFKLHALINTFDVPVNKKKLKQEESPLSLELKELIYPTGTSEIQKDYDGITIIQSFNDYRLSATVDSARGEIVNNRISAFFKQVDAFFIHTKKKIAIESTNKIVFKTENETLQIEQLSAGEKQLLIILFRVFFMEERPYLILMDEPEISLHIEWQQKLIDAIRQINPNSQLILTTHSPSIFGRGWGDKLIFTEELRK